MEKKKMYIISLLLIGIVIITGTFAWLTWKSNETSLVLTVGDINNVQVVLKPYQISREIIPVLTYTSEEYTEVSVVNNSLKSKKVKLYYHVNNIDSELISSDFLYTIEKSTDDGNTYTEYLSGNFSSATDNSDLYIMDETIPKNTSYKYRVYLWLDGSNSSQGSIQGKKFSGELRAELDSVNNIIVDLSDGLIPITYDVSGNNTIVKTISSDDENWYDYNNKEWANAVLVKESGDNTREYYQNNVGVEVSEDDILAYYVWIPRYKYRIPEGKCSTLTNPTIEEYPSCYVYLLSDSDKTLLINWCYSYLQDAGFTSYTLEEATTDVNNALQTGTFSNATLGIEAPTSEFIASYNQDNSDNQITYTTEFSSSKNYTGPREIDIIYEDKSTAKILGDAVNTYYTHPAFTFGNTEVNGIWVGKFETGGTATAPLIKPNISSLRNQKVSEEFTTAQIFGTSTYGMTSNVDAHMMKNSEWGAVAYLSHSRYGVNRELYINNSSGYYTGRSGGNVGGSTAINTVYTDQTSTATYNTYGFYTWDGYLLEYDTNTKTSTHDISKVASTTGNITGVYDMSGGTYEYVMGYYSPASSTWGATSDDNYAGFTSQPNSKYYDDYTTTSSLTACNGGICYGHGLSEVSNWYGDDVDFVNDGRPWFLRSGSCYSGSFAGAFYFGLDDGGAFDNVAARSVLLLDSNK